MDAITALALSIDNPFLKGIGLLIGNSFIYAALVIAALLAGENRDEKRRKIIASILLAFLAVSAIKYVIAKERPCLGDEWCPEGYSFPSMHAAIAFTLMIGFMNKKSFPLFLLFALFVCFTRMNLAAHVFGDIAGALPIAMLSYYFTDIFWRKEDEAAASERTKEYGREFWRQMFHLGVGIVALVFLLLMGRGYLLAALFFILVIGTLLINARLLGASLPLVIPLVQWFEERFERKDAPLPGWGSACYATGALLAASFLSDAGQIAAVIFVLGAGDALSTVVGMRGSIKLPFNPKKTLEGTLAMFVSSLGAYLFIGPAAIPLAIIATFAESLPLIDDNLSIPIACVIFFLVV